MKKYTRLFVLLIAISLLLPFIPQSVMAKTAEEQAKEDRANRPGRILVGLGDSYASGEGLGDYGDSTDLGDKVQDENWIAHRSNHSWAGMLTLPDCTGTMQENRGTNFFFAASSGAVSSNVNRSGRGSEQKKEIYRKNWSNLREVYKGEYNMPGQLDVFYKNPALDRNEVDYVTMSIGGNDVNFDKIITAAANPASDVTARDLINKELAKMSTTISNLEETYRRVAEAAPNATIIITGYPPLIAKGGGNSWLFNEDEASAIADGVTQFNNAIKEKINQLKKAGMKIEFVDIESEFKGHEAYSDDPWISGIYYSDQDDIDESLDKASMKSMHPNQKGANAYARLVQERINEIEEAKRLRREGADISKKRNIVLVLDKSGSMEGSPIQETKSASKNFVDKILKQDASVGIVTFSSGAGIISSFSKDASSLKSAIEGISTDGRTNTSAGLSAAAGMLRACDEGERIIILMSDGLTNEGLMGEALSNYIESLKDADIRVCTMGYFESLSGSDLKDAQNFMEKSATAGNHYEIGNSDDIVYAFDDMAEQINGAEYAYARIACPVDVQVTVGDEVLSSAENKTRTSFGTLTFEAGDDEDGSGTDNRIKILRLKEDKAKYKIEIRGNGEGTMNYTAGYMDENGEYSDLREIKDVPITENTIIEANASRNEATTLKLDADGDGSFDSSISVGGPPRKWWILIVAGGILALAAGVILLVTRKKPAAAMVPAMAQAYPAYPAAAPVQPVQFTQAAPPAQQMQFTQAPAQAAPTAAAGTQNASEFKFCRFCGKKLKKSAQFCSSCGNKL